MLAAFNPSIIAERYGMKETESRICGWTMQVTTCFISHSSYTATFYTDLTGDSTRVVPPESSQCFLFLVPVVAGEHIVQWFSPGWLNYIMWTCVLFQTFEIGLNAFWPFTRDPGFLFSAHFLSLCVLLTLRLLCLPSSKNLSLKRIWIWKRWVLK